MLLCVEYLLRNWYPSWHQSHSVAHDATVQYIYLVSLDK